MTFLDQLLTIQNGILALAVWAVLGTLKGLPAIRDTRLFLRLLPILPPILGILASLLGLGSGASVTEQIAIGLIFGFAAGQGFKIGKTSILGHGLPEKPAEKNTNH